MWDSAASTVQGVIGPLGVILVTALIILFAAAFVAIATNRKNDD